MSAPLTYGEIVARIDPESRSGIEGVLVPHLPDGPLTVESVRALDERIAVRGPESALSITIPRPTGSESDGSALEVRLHEPGSGSSSAAILWIHGGGMFLGSARYDDELCRELSQTLGVSVAAVSYRLAPEHRHPEPLLDCATALQWLAERHDSVIVAGSSAGGGLALALALWARDHAGPSIRAVYAHAPMIDDRRSTASAVELADTVVWNDRLATLAWHAYLGDRPADVYAAPARATELAGHPPSYIDVGEFDLFRDECVAYAEALAAADVPVELHVDAGGYHASEYLAPDAPLSRRIRQRRVESMRRALASARKDRVLP